METRRKNSIGVGVEDEVVEDYTLEVNGTLIYVKGCEISSIKQRRYYASFSYKETKYFLSGIMEQEEFEKMLKNLYFLKIALVFGRLCVLIYRKR